jgi:hypothetical protein
MRSANNMVSRACDLRGPHVQRTIPGSDVMLQEKLLPAGNQYIVNKAKLFLAKL